MKDFFKYFFPCLLAVVAGGFVTVIIFLVITFSMVGSTINSMTMSMYGDKVSSGNVLKLDFSEIITDQPSSNFLVNFDMVNFNMERHISLLEVLHAIEKAETDPAIKCIYIAPSMGMNVGMATLEEIRAALEKFKKCGKKIYGYAEFMTQGGFYISSVADSLYINPAGDLIWSGMSSETVFFKGLLDKVGVEAEIFRCGDFKSAVEPYMTTKMSDASKLQTEKLLGSIWDETVVQVAQSRNIDTATLQKAASELTYSRLEYAKNQQVITDLLYEDQVIEKMEQQIGTSVSFISLGDYGTGLAHNSKSKNLVAVLYAQGEINSGKSSDGVIGSQTLVKSLRKLRDDDNVKAVVFRVNSPGGSALAADVIWREVSLLQKVKPVIVSMGDYAASGGYYIAAPADAILAMPATITGSIGVFGIMFNAEKGLRDELGITSDKVATNSSSGMGSILSPLNAAQRASMQSSVDKTYSIFLEHVARGRNMTVQAVTDVAGGRVWSGSSALGNGLIDGLGGLKDAISLAAQKAELGADFKIVTPVPEDDSMSNILSLLTGAKTSKSRYETLTNEYDGLKRVFSKGAEVQALMPYRINIE